MFQLGLAYAIQADREREIQEMVRQRRLLEPQPEVRATPEPATRSGSAARRPRVRARANSG